jgi:phage terminase large subunit-like protein
MNYVKLYLERIEDDDIKVCDLLYQELKTLVADMSNPLYRFDEEAGSKPIRFIEKYCRHSKGEWAGSKIELELCQKAYLQAKYGFRYAESGLRRFRESMLLMARKNAKSTLSSGEALYLLSFDNEGGAEIYTVATKKDQAKIIYDECARMVAQSPTLRKVLKKRKTNIEFASNFSKLEALASDSDTLDGLNVHGAFFDELHAIKDRNLYEVIKQGMKARRQPMLTMITTAGTVREGIYDDIYDYAVKVIKKEVDDPSFLPWLYQLDSEEEYLDSSCWIKANPLLGVSKKWDALAADVKRAKDDPKYLKGLLCKDFNLRQTGVDSWLTFDVINCEDTLDMEFLRGCYAIGGVDLSSSVDLTCATLLIYKHGKFYVLQKYFLPGRAIERYSQSTNIPFDKWQEAGWLDASGDTKIEYTDVTNWFIKMMDEYDIRPYWIGYDRYSAQYWVDEMKAYGFIMVDIIQGALTMSKPMQELGADLEAKIVNYNNNPMLKWCLTNTCIAVDPNNNIRPVKSRSPKMRIDGAVSLIDAYVVFSRERESYFNLIGEQGIIPG